MFTGCGTALVTPFRRDLSLDEETLRRLVRRDLVVAGLGSLIAVWTSSLLLAARLGFIHHQSADKAVAAPPVAGADCPPLIITGG